MGHLMISALHPAVALHAARKQLPSLAACEHYAGTEKMLRKALQLQGEYATDRGSIFDITADCEDGTSVGSEAAQASMVATLINDPANRCNRVGARIHDVTHPHWREDIEIIVGAAGRTVAYIVLPKANSAADVVNQISQINAECARNQISRTMPIHVLIETHGALHDVWQIAGLPQVESIDFGLMDFVSEHIGAIPASAMTSPAQFEHPLIARAKAQITAAALGNGIIPAHNVTTELRDANVVRSDAQRAFREFGFLRMWSIHPNQILPIVEAMQPDASEVNDACEILIQAQDAGWGPIQYAGRLHDRASYRYFWEILRRASATGMQLPAKATQRFFESLPN